MKANDIAVSTTAREARLPGRVILLACLNCVQAIAPDWPLVILWPCIRISLTSSMVRWARPRGFPTKAIESARWCLVREKMIKFLRDNYPRCLPSRCDAVTLNALTSAKGEAIEALRNAPHRTL